MWRVTEPSRCSGNSNPLLSDSSSLPAHTGLLQDFGSQRCWNHYPVLVQNKSLCFGQVMSGSVECRGRQKPGHSMWPAISYAGGDCLEVCVILCSFSYLSGEIGLLVTTASMYALTRWSVSDSVLRLKGLLDRVSATINRFPGTCTAVTLNLMRRIKSIRTGVLSRSHALISGTSGL